MNLKHYLTRQFLFDINRVLIQQSDKAFLAAGIVLAVLGGVFFVAAKFAPTPVDSRIRGRLKRCFLTAGILEIVWYAARWQEVTFFGSHFVALLILLIAAVWLAFIITDIVKHYRPQLQSWEKEQVKLKYLPK